MAFIGSSPISNNLVFPDVSYVTGPTGPTGPIGPVGLSLIGFTGNTGPRFKSANISGKVFGITYDTSGFFLNVTGPSGSSQRVNGITFTVRETGSAAGSFSIFGGFDPNDTYKFLFKTLKVSGEATAGISGNAIYIGSFSGITINPTIGNTGSLFYISPGTGGFGNAISPTNDTITNYIRSVITPSGLSGKTLDTFSFRIKQDFNVLFGYGKTGNINFYMNAGVAETTVPALLASNNVINSTAYGVTFNRTDQGTFVNILNYGSYNYPKVSFRAEGITLNSPSTQYNPIQIDLVGKGITYTNKTFKDSVLGSCCYCKRSASQRINKECFDYSTQEFCDQIGGSFSFKTCVDRYQSDDCYSGGACCVNETCLETNTELCTKINGDFYPNARCSEINCPFLCSTDLNSSCCAGGQCYKLNDSAESEGICDAIGGKYQRNIPCSSRNCCFEGFYGACCLNPNVGTLSESGFCIDNSTPIECKQRNGVFQGAGRLCVSSRCCTEDQDFDTLRSSFINQNNFIIDSSVKIGDFFEGGIVAGFVGYPNPSNIVSGDSFFAKGQLITDLENIPNADILTYAPVTGVYNPATRCNCSNFSPSRYVTYNQLSRSSGRILPSDAKSLTGVVDNYKLTFFNRLSDICLQNENRPCTDQGQIYKKYGFNSVLAYKNLSKQIYENQIPSAWLLIVSPEDFSDEDVSFGMNMGVDNFSTPSGYENYNQELWQNNLLTPYGTTVFDGFVNTRLLDETSIERNNWFIPTNYIINGSIINSDPLAYHRFNHSLSSNWQSQIDKQRIMVDSSYFKEKYKEMWHTLNHNKTALGIISKKNKENYNGYSDWYIPSAVELNMIYNNLEKINDGLITGNNTSHRTISNKSNYWTSTTGGKIVKFISEIDGARVYQGGDQSLEPQVKSNDPLLDTWKSYKLSQAHRTYMQNMGTGLMGSSLKRLPSARVRGVRMIPIYFKNEDFSKQFEYSYKSLNTCDTCR